MQTWIDKNTGTAYFKSATGKYGSYCLTKRLSLFSVTKNGLIFEKECKSLCDALKHMYRIGGKDAN